MSQDQVQAARFATIVASLNQNGNVMDRFCEASALFLDADGAAITLNYDSPTRATVSSTSELALLIEEAQEIVGEGPGFDAIRTQTVVSGTFGTLADTSWPALEDSIAHLMFAGEVVAVPITARGRQLGVFSAHRLATSLTFDPAPTRYLAAALGPVLLDHLDPATLDEEFTDDWTSRAVIHQATGMVLSQLRISSSDALALLRAHAYAIEASLTEVAHRVVDRELTFDNLSVEGE